MTELTINELEEEVSRLEDQLREAKERLFAARVEAAPFKVGQEVEATVQHQWKRAVVRRLTRSQWSDRVNYWVSIYLANGELAKSEHRIWSEHSIRAAPK